MNRSQSKHLQFSLESVTGQQANTIQNRGEPILRNLQVVSHVFPTSVTLQVNRTNF